MNYSLFPIHHINSFSHIYLTYLISILLQFFLFYINFIFIYFYFIFFLFVYLLTLSAINTLMLSSQNVLTSATIVHRNKSIIFRTLFFQSWTSDFFSTLFTDFRLMDFRKRHKKYCYGNNQVLLNICMFMRS